MFNKTCKSLAIGGGCEGIRVFRAHPQIGGDKVESLTSARDNLDPFLPPIIITTCFSHHPEYHIRLALSSFPAYSKQWEHGASNQNVKLIKDQNFVDFRKSSINCVTVSAIGQNQSLVIQYLSFLPQSSLSVSMTLPSKPSSHMNLIFVIFLRHHIFWPVNCMPEKCVNLRQKLHSDKTA